MVPTKDMIISALNFGSGVLTVKDVLIEKTTMDKYEKAIERGRKRLKKQ